MIHKKLISKKSIIKTLKHNNFRKNLYQKLITKYKPKVYSKLLKQIRGILINISIPPTEYHFIYMKNKREYRIYKK